MEEHIREWLDKTYQIKMKILKNGDSKLLKDWQRYSSITEDQFADAIKWICEDPKNYAALTSTGWEKIRRVDDANGMSTFRYLNGFLWSGAGFTIPLTEKEQEFYGDSCRKVFQKIAISASDRI